MKKLLSIILVVCLMLTCCGLFSGCEAPTNENEEPPAPPTKQWTQEEVLQIINIYKVKYKTNSVGGVSVDIDFKNTSTKDIKYLYFTVSPFNAVNDIVACEVSGKTSATLKMTGPIYDDIKYSWVEWENVWYNSTIWKVVIYRIEIEYMDGTSVMIEGDAVRYAYVDD